MLASGDHDVRDLAIISIYESVDSGWLKRAREFVGPECPIDEVPGITNAGGELTNAEGVE